MCAMIVGGLQFRMHNSIPEIAQASTFAALPARN